MQINAQDDKNKKQTEWWREISLRSWGLNLAIKKGYDLAIY